MLLACLPAFGRTDRAENCLRMERGETGDNREEDRRDVDNSFVAISSEKEIFSFPSTLNSFLEGSTLRLFSTQDLDPEHKNGHSGTRS